MKKILCYPILGYSIMLQAMVPDHAIQVPEPQSTLDLVLSKAIKKKNHEQQLADLKAQLECRNKALEQLVNEQKNPQLTRGLRSGIHRVQHDIGQTIKVDISALREANDDQTKFEKRRVLINRICTAGQGIFYCAVGLGVGIYITVRRIDQDNEDDDGNIIADIIIGNLTNVGAFATGTYLVSKAIIGTEGKALEKAGTATEEYINSIGNLLENQKRLSEQLQKLGVDTSDNLTAPPTLLMEGGPSMAQSPLLAPTESNDRETAEGLLTRAQQALNALGSYLFSKQASPSDQSDILDALERGEGTTPSSLSRQSSSVNTHDTTGGTETNDSSSSASNRSRSTSQNTEDEAS